MGYFLTGLICLGVGVAAGAVGMWMYKERAVKALQDAKKKVEDALKKAEEVGKVIKG